MADLKQPTHYIILRNPTDGTKQVDTITDGSIERLAVDAKAEVDAVITSESSTRLFQHFSNGASIAATVTNGKDAVYNLDDGDTLTVKVDGGSVQTATFNTGDFVDIDNATAAEVVTVLNTDITGQTASVSGSRIKMTSDTTGSSSTLEVTGGTGNFGAAKLQFPLNVNFGEPGSIELNIDASQGVVTFTVDADSTLNTFIENVHLFIEDASVAYDKFGGLPQLTSGIELFIEQGGARKDIIQRATILAEVAKFLPANGTEIVVGLSTEFFISVFMFPQTIFLDAGSSDALKIRIQDDLTGLTRFRVFATGFTRA